MHWSTLLYVALCGISPSTSQVATTTPPATAFTSYTQAWNAARETERPMLVILNPGDSSQARKITESELRNDPQVDRLMEKYVVAVIDTTTEHGRKVNDLFQTPALPRVVVIDKAQKKQIYQSSGDHSAETLAIVLKKYQDGSGSHAPVINSASKPMTTSNSPISIPNYGNCQSCQKRYSFR